MKLEPIDTSTTAGKARVMQLAAEGRTVVCRACGDAQWCKHNSPQWNWESSQYAIIAQPVGPDEVFVVFRSDTGGVMGVSQEEWHTTALVKDGGTVVRYRRVEE